MSCYTTITIDADTTKLASRELLRRAVESAHEEGVELLEVNVGVKSWGVCLSKRMINAVMEMECRRGEENKRSTNFNFEFIPKKTELEVVYGGELSYVTTEKGCGVVAIFRKTTNLEDLTRLVAEAIAPRVDTTYAQLEETLELELSYRRYRVKSWDPRCLLKLLQECRFNKIDFVELIHEQGLGRVVYMSTRFVDSAVIEEVGLLLSDSEHCLKRMYMPYVIGPTSSVIQLSLRGANFPLYTKASIECDGSFFRSVVSKMHS